VGNGPNNRVQAILQGNAAASWLARLTKAFFDGDAKRQVITGIHEEIAAMFPKMRPGELEGFQQAVLSHLIGLASRDASPPTSEIVAPQILCGPELENHVIANYPYPIATPYRSLTEQESAAGAFGCLLDTFESLVHFLATVAVSAYLRSGLGSSECNRHLLERFLKEGWSAGDLLALLRDTIRFGGDCAGLLPYPELPVYLFTPRGKPTASGLVLESFVTLRNRAWGHGTGREEAFYAEILPANRARLEKELGLLRWLADWELIRPTAINEAGLLTRADLLTGDRRQKARPYELLLAPNDLDHQGGDVRAEKALLLVAPDRRRYLPLFPLSLFHFQLHSQGVYFLQRPLWERSPAGPQLRKAGYVAYEAGLAEHEASRSDPAVRSLEQHIQRLEASLVRAGVVLGELPVEPVRAKDPEHELPEVRHEQEFHLRTFAGREGLLQAVAQWVGDRAKGGYLLLLAPPGQGKSALMAELARRERGGPGCLLHMVKSHRNPLKFVPALISQAAKLARAQFGAVAYRGDLDDLRNALLRALEAVREKTGRALVLIDALDELESSGERIGFLPATLPAGAKLVLTCRPDIPLVQALRARLQPLEEMKLPPLSEEDMPLVIRRRLDARTLASLESRVNWRELFQRLQGNPLFLQRALERITQAVAIAQKEAKPPDLDLSTLPTTLEALFQDIYNEIGEKEGTRFRSPEGRQKSRLLQFLCLARESLDFEQLSGLMAADGTGLSLEECRDRLFEMSQYLLDTGGNRFKPWHQGLVDYVRTQILRESGCRQAEQTFAAWLRMESPRPGTYGLRHRAQHLLVAERFDEFGELLTSYSFLESKVQARMVFDLVHDLSEGIERLPEDHLCLPTLNVLYQVFRMEARFLAMHPGCLFQCLWNSGWWYDCPEGAKHYEPPEGGWPPEGPPWARPGPKVCHLVEAWRARKEQAAPGSPWVRSVQPPRFHLDAVQRKATRRVYYPRDSAYHDVEVEALLVAVCRGHDEPICGLSFTSDGRHVITASSDRSLRIWDVQTGVEHMRLVSHRRPITGVAFSPDGLTVACASQNQTVWLWDIRHPAEQVPRQLYSPDGPATHLAFSPDGGRVAGASANAIHIWDVQRGEEQAILKGHTGLVCCFAFSPDGALFASGSEDMTVRLWDAHQGRELACLRGHLGRVWSLAFSPEGRRLASGSEDRNVLIWEVEAASKVARLSGHQDWVTRVAFSSDSRRLAAGVANGTVSIWEIAQKTLVDAIDGIADVCAAASGAPQFPWRAVSGLLETRIESAATGTVIAWFPRTLRYILTHPAGRTWAGTNENQLHLFTLENAP
jgi:hypothetical protein